MLSTITQSTPGYSDYAEAGQRSNLGGKDDNKNNKDYTEYPSEPCE